MHLSSSPGDPLESLHSRQSLQRTEGASAVDVRLPPLADGLDCTTMAPMIDIISLQAGSTGSLLAANVTPDAATGVLACSMWQCCAQQHLV